MAARKPLIVGNWKMHGRREDLAEIAGLAERTGSVLERLDVVTCPPAVYLEAAVRLASGLGIWIGGQDCSSVFADAARTGEISASMLAEIGARYVIVGHSERRALLGETDELVCLKAESALAAGLTPIICVGETRSERDAGSAAEVVARQIHSSVPQTGAIAVAYEPVWAIGGDRTPTPAEIGEIHSLIRSELGGRGGLTRVLYGGSVSPKNAGEIFAVADVDGALVGRACLKALDFAAIVMAHPAAN